MLYNIILIRHGKTAGNLRHEYVGATDQPLCREGIDEVVSYKSSSRYPKVDHVFVSPMQRCLQTMKLIYGDIAHSVIPELKECDFGLFEGKTHQELEDTLYYQKWVADGATGHIPGGEDTEAFKERCCQGFQEVVDYILTHNIINSALIVHGGTIMSILDRYSGEKQDFFHWQTQNGCGFKLVIDKDFWLKTKELFKFDKV